MIDEISIMIELQHYWDLVMEHEADSERCRKSIRTWEIRLTDIRDTLSKKENSLKNMKLKTKQAELNLQELESKITKTEQRMDNLKSEREIDAQNNELKKLKDEKNSLENEILNYFDEIENAESLVEKLKVELADTSMQTETDLINLREKISANESEVNNNKARFNEIIESLSPANRTKFSKLISSKDGKAIARLNGETCSHCNFQIPSSIALAAARREALHTCTNCGRFIY